MQRNVAGATTGKEKRKKPPMAKIAARVEEGGRLKFASGADCNNYKRFLDGAVGKEILITLKRIYRQRSVDQNAFFHGIVIPAFCKLWNKDVKNERHFLIVKNRIKEMFLTRLTSTGNLYVMGTSDLTIEEMMELITGCLNYLMERGRDVELGSGFQMISETTAEERIAPVDVVTRVARNGNGKPEFLYANTIYKTVYSDFMRRNVGREINITLKHCQGNRKKIDRGAFFHFVVIPSFCRAMGHDPRLREDVLYVKYMLQEQFLKGYDNDGEEYIRDVGDLKAREYSEFIERCIEELIQISGGRIPNAQIIDYYAIIGKLKAKI